jgi:heme A synthase
VDELRRFRRLVALTIAATGVLILIGGIVRVSDSGLGCGPAGSGIEGWPLCSGRLLPFLELSAVVEFSHRAMAGVVGILILVLAVTVVRRLREHRWLVRGTAAAGVLVLLQAGLGGLTVENNLDEALVAAHLGLAMLLLGTLLALHRASGTMALPHSTRASPGLRWLAVAASTLVLATIVAGGYVAGTEKEGVENAPAGGAHLACGEEFPTCLGELMPFGRAHLIDVQLAHRALMLMAALALLATFALANRQGVRNRAMTAAGAILVLQIGLGAANVWLGKHPGLVVAHLAGGTLLWSLTLAATLRLLPVPGRAPAQAQSAASLGKEPGWKPA